MIPRLILLVIVTALGIWYTMHYADQVKKDPTKSLVYAQRAEDEKRFDISEKTQDTQPLTKVQKRVLWLFGITFIIMIMGLVPWTDLNKHWTAFDTFTNWLHGIPFLGVLIGKDIPALGTWYFNEITLLFIFMSVVIMFVAHMKESEFIDAFLKGMGDLLSVAIIVAVARGIQVIMNNGMITATVLHWGEVGLGGLSRSAFIILTYIFYIPMSFLIPSTSGLAAATMGIMQSGYHGLPSSFWLDQPDYANFRNRNGGLGNCARQHQYLVEVDGQVHGDPVPGYLRLLRYCRGTLAFFNHIRGN